MKLEDALSQYLNHFPPETSESHLKSVQSRIGRFVRDSDLAVESITGDVIAAHFDRLKAAGLLDGTLAGHKSTHRAFWRWCLARGLVDSDPSAVLKSKKYAYSYRPVRSRSAPRNDFQRVIDALPAFTAKRGGHLQDLRDALIVSLTIDSTARRDSIRDIRCEAMRQALRRGEPVGDGRTVYRVSARSKTGSVVVRFFDESAAVARDYLEKLPRTAVFICANLGTLEQLHQDSMSRSFARVCKFAGVPVFRFQATRKRNVTDAIRAVGDQQAGQRLAGHKSIATTQLHYNEVEEEDTAVLAGWLATQRRGRPPGDNLASEFFANLG